MNAPYRSTEPAASAGLTAYRPFIDGLRAVAVLAVVLYHVGLPGIPGGYVGVDVFFVISGFLIVNQITEGLDRGSFRFAEFWARRALRILPPYVLVLAASTAAFPLVLIMPEEMQDFGREASYSAMMFVNHLFLEQQGYFDGPADLKPLLHLWSLSVEEQFYLAAPVMSAGLYVLVRRSKLPNARERYAGWSAFAVFVASLAACILFTGAAGGRNHAFYLMPLRAWEFVAGSSLALILPRASTRLRRGQVSALAAAGLAAIVVAAIAYSPETPYPSFFATLPVFGAAAIILAGLAHPEAPAVRLLASRPMVYIGLVSYSWYLWHWPLLAFARILHFGERLLWLDALLGIVSLGLAIATYHLLEKPIREWRRRGGSGLGWRPVIAGVLACAAFAAGSKTLAFRLADERAAAVEAAGIKPDYGPRNVFCDLEGAATTADCLKLTAGRPTGLLIGDSQVRTAANRFAGFANDHGTGIVAHASAGCVAILGVRVFMYDRNMEADCIAMKQSGARLLADGLKPDYAILYSRWPIYGAVDRNFALGAEGSGEPAPDQAAIFVEGLRRTLADLRARGVQRVLVVGPTPLFSRPAPRCLYLARKHGAGGEKACGVSRADHDALSAESVRRIRLALAGAEGVRYIDPSDAFCNEERCLPYAGDDVLFIDANHLSYAGTGRLIEQHRDDFEWVVGARSGS